MIDLGSTPLSLIITRFTRYPSLSTKGGVDEVAPAVVEVGRGCSSESVPTASVPLLLLLLLLILLLLLRLLLLVVILVIWEAISRFIRSILATKGSKNANVLPEPLKIQSRQKINTNQR